MGHTRLGAIPKSRRWNELVEEITGLHHSSSSVSSAATIVDGIAARTLDVAEGSLRYAVADPGVRYTFYLLTQVALASRTPDWAIALGKYGIHLPSDSTIFDLTVELQAAIDRHLNQTRSGSTDLSEIASNPLARHSPLL